MMEPQHGKSTHPVSGWLVAFLLTAGVIAGPAGHLDAQDVPPARYGMPEVVVTASRLPSTFLNVARHVTVLDSSDIAMLPVQSMQDLLTYVQGADIRQRGPLGVQADVGFRGSSFEQTLVLLNGMKITDPQTGHHNLNLPVTLQDVNRVEVLHGQGSSVYGPNAFGGVINIITQRPRGTALTTNLTGGAHGLVEGDIAADYMLGSTANQLSFARRQSEGYRHNTAFHITSIAQQTAIGSGDEAVRLFAGYVDKAFGANGFYSTRFPDQYEHTRTGILHAGTRFNLRHMQVTPKIIWRRNYDDFILDNTRPDWYRNKHTTDSYGAEIQSTMESSLGRSAFGGELGVERIASSSLGDHHRERIGLFVEQQATVAHLIQVMLGISAYYHTSWGWQTLPDFGLSIPLSRQFRLYGNVGEAYRVPNFTELYYDSPANKGNPNLEPERALSFEGGLKWVKPAFLGDVSVFRRNGTNMIDWARSSAADPWVVKNIASIRTTGAEINLRAFPDRIPGMDFLRKVQLKYVYLHSDLASLSDMESKYVLDHLRHQLIGDVVLDLPLKIEQRLTVRYEDRIHGDHYGLLDTRLSRPAGMVRIYLDVTNLLDTAYEEFPGLPMPGRWIRVGVETRIQ